MLRFNTLLTQLTFSIVTINWFIKRYDVYKILVCITNDPALFLFLLSCRFYLWFLICLSFNIWYVLSAVNKLLNINVFKHARFKFLISQVRLWGIKNSFTLSYNNVFSHSRSALRVNSIIKHSLFRKINKLVRFFIQILCNTIIRINVSNLIACDLLLFRLQLILFIISYSLWCIQILWLLFHQFSIVCSNSWSEPINLILCSWNNRLIVSTTGIKMSYTEIIIIIYFLDLNLLNPVTLHWLNSTVALQWQIFKKIRLLITLVNLMLTNLTRYSFIILFILYLCACFILIQTFVIFCKLPWDFLLYFFTFLK